MWVKFQDDQIVEGPVHGDKPSDAFIEYVENISLPQFYSRMDVTVSLVDGKCVKTVTARPDYSAQRAAEYPPLGDQLDGFWHAMDDNLIPKVEPFYSQVKAVKDKYPKPPTA
jgi:hypothetical protein